MEEEMEEKEMVVLVVKWRWRRWSNGRPRQGLWLWFVGLLAVKGRREKGK